jgi:tetratricopeptide (TPR) repeat protein
MRISKTAYKGEKYMISAFRGAAVMFVVAGIIASGFLLAGCKKPQPKQPVPSTSIQPPVQVDKGSTAPTPQTAVPPEAKLNMLQGASYYKSHNFDKAIKEFTAAIEKYPNYDLAYSDRAAAYAQQKKFSKASDDLKKAVEINPGNPVVHYNLASLYSLQNRSDLALDSLDRALELGFKDYNFLLNDPDLNNVRKHPEFRKILAKHKVSTSK